MQNKMLLLKQSLNPKLLEAIRSNSVISKNKLYQSYKLKWSQIKL